MSIQDIDRAAQKAGIADSFTAIDGTQRLTSLETKISLLTAMAPAGIPPFTNDIQADITTSVFRSGDIFQVSLDKIQDVKWQLTAEKGQIWQGETNASAKILLPPELPLGYHKLLLETSDRRWQLKIIIAPQRCFEPQAIVEKQKMWGVALQLYTLRSEHNWGIGDFGDLHNVIDEISQRGGAFIGLNPLHALFPANPNSASPYSPSSRQWLNIIYIDINQLDEFKQSKEAQTWFNSTLTQERLHAARACDWVDYNAVTRLKLEGLRLAFNFFQKQSDLEKHANFELFIGNGGDSLQRQATFDALQAMLNTTDVNANYWGWPVWPAEYQEINSQAINNFQQSHRDEILFFCWLQWQAKLQLESCYQHCQNNQMPIGLYRDLAVGASEGGADVWSDRALYATGASIGAPPDPLGPLGQNWGLPPINPHVLQQRGYQPFIELLRANMACCGALRIDHVMALLRLWWIPYGQSSEEGAYVHYPLDDLLGILALESQRNQCVIIGEDLGTVPLEIIDRLRDSGVYSYRVLYFQQGGHNDFFLPQDYPEQAMATIATHDLPTLHSFWLSNDLTLGSALKLYPDRHELYSLYNERSAAKQGLLQAMHYVGYELDEEDNVTLTLPMNDALSLLILRYIASSHSALLGIQLEDLLGTLLPVNIPGTDTEYANWRRKLHRPLEEIFSNPELNHLLDEVNQIRRAINI